MARKSSADVAKEKAAKQKKMAIGLSVLLVLAMGYAFKTMSGLNSGGSKPQAADTTAVTTTPVPSATTPAAAPTATPSLAAPTLGASTPDASAGAPTTGSDDLVSAVTPTLDAGQMQTFDKFSTKDPFVSGSAATKPSVVPKTVVPRVPTPPATATTSTPTKPPAVAPTSAVLSVNGVQESITTGGTFPSANPMFQLVSLTATAAKVTVIGGSYASGASTLTLTVGKPVTLVNTADGTRYKLILYPQGTAVATSTVASPTPAPTTPTTTTTGG